MNQESRINGNRCPRFATPKSRHPCQRHAALTPRARFVLKGNASRRCPLSMNSSASDEHPAPVFRPFPQSSKSAGGLPLTSASHTANARARGYSTNLPVNGSMVGFSGRPSFRPSRVLSYRANRTNASSSCCFPDGAAVSPPRALGAGRLWGAQDSITAPLHTPTFVTSLACHRCPVVRPFCPVSCISSSRARRPGCFTAKLSADPS